MSNIRSKDMAPEIYVRRIVHRMGYRYRLHRNDLPGKPDLVFSGRRKIIFIHGCFWHQHKNCKIAHLPKSNLKYWIPKLKRNVQRDKKTLIELERMGWEVLIVWECEINKPDKIIEKISTFLKK